MAGLREIVVPDGTTDTSVTLGPHDALRPETIEATFDGAGAATPFLPCVTLYDPTGRKLSRTFPASLMAAGEKGGVTFAPF